MHEHDEADLCLSADDAVIFDAYFGAKKGLSHPWRRLLIAVSVAAHAVLVAALIIQGYWLVDKLSPPKRSVVVASLVPFLDVAKPPKSTPAPTPAARKGDGVRGNKATSIPTAAKLAPHPAPGGEVEPRPTAAVVVAVAADDGGGNGRVTGITGGVTNGVVGGELGGAADGVLAALDESGGMSPPPQPPRTPNVTFVALESRRIAGTRDVTPNTETQEQIEAHGKTMVTATVQLCVDSDGRPSRLTMVKPSGYPAYDRSIRAAMQQWRYRPFMMDGQATSVCTRVNFIYRQEHARSR